MTEIKTKEEPKERESQKQRHWNIVQLQNTWLAVGITIVGISVAAASLPQRSWIAVILLFVIGVIICVFSPWIASLIVKVESKRMQNISDTATRRIEVPKSLKNLATAAAWVLFILGCISLLCGIANLALLSFNILSVESPLSVQGVFVGFGILCLILAFVAAMIRSKIE